jgi:hypothetical protein
MTMSVVTSVKTARLEEGAALGGAAASAAPRLTIFYV